MPDIELFRPSLGLEITDDSPLKIDYQPSRKALQFDFQKFENIADIDLLKKLVSIKFEEWRYEREWRILLPLDYDQNLERPQYFYKQFTPEFELREVILGARCERQLEDMSKNIFGITASVILKRARPAFEAFNMVQQKLERPITINPLGDFTKAERRLAAAERSTKARDADRALKRSKL